MSYPTDDDFRAHGRPAPPARRFPIQEDERGLGSTIPWEKAERAYETYARLFGTTQSLERLAEWGGFGTSEFACLYNGHAPLGCVQHADCLLMAFADSAMHNLSIYPAMAFAETPVWASALFAEWSAKAGPKERPSPDTVRKHLGVSWQTTPTASLHLGLCRHRMIARLSVGFFMHSPEAQHGETWGCTAEQKAALDELHL